MSYLLSSLKNAEQLRKQNLCQNQDVHAEQDESSNNQAPQSSALTSATSSFESTDPPEENLFLENSSNQFSTKKNLTYVFLFSGMCFVVIVCLAWFYMKKSPTQDSKLIPDSAKAAIPLQDNLQLKLETELLFPAPFPAPSHKQQKSTTDKK